MFVTLNRAGTLIFLQHPLNDTIPVFPMPPKNPETALYLGVNAYANGTGHLIWTINDRTFRDDDSNLILLLANNRNATGIYRPDWNVYDLGTNSTVRIILRNEQWAATYISHVSVFKFPPPPTSN